VKNVLHRFRVMCYFENWMQEFRWSHNTRPSTGLVTVRDLAMLVF